MKQQHIQKSSFFSRAKMEERESIYKISRKIKRKESTLYNALRSIYEDSIFVGEIRQLWPELPLLANLRCGLWYSRKFDFNCYFKSTDGHTNNLSFNTSRLNLHVALLAGQRGGCMIVDSTRKGKRFPDSMSKTIPIWTCVLNRAIFNFRSRLDRHDVLLDDQDSCGWDCSLHLPLWVSETEKAMIEKRLEVWTNELESSGADIASTALSLKKPLRPLWISPKTVIWLNEVPEYDSWDFTPVILISASASSAALQQNRNTSEFSWNYIAGAGDDEESWARGLSPDLFWKHAYDIISSGPDLCNKNISIIVEEDRVRRAQRGESAPQVSVKPSKSVGSSSRFPIEEELELDKSSAEDEKISDDIGLTFLGSTNIAVGKSQNGEWTMKSSWQAMLDFQCNYENSSYNCCNLSIVKQYLAAEVPPAYCILNCDKESLHVSLKNHEMYLHLPIVDCKFDRFSLLRNLPSALDFAKTHLRNGNKLLICCSSGEDLSICVCLAILASFYDEAGHFDDGKSFNKAKLSKLELRKRLVFICNYAVNARPSRGNLKQVFACLSGGGIPSIS